MVERASKSRTSVSTRVRVERRPLFGRTSGSRTDGGYCGWSVDVRIVIAKRLRPVLAVLRGRNLGRAREVRLRAARHDDVHVERRDVLARLERDELGAVERLALGHRPHLAGLDDPF